MGNVAILGCSGRMGRALLEALGERNDLILSGALASSRSTALGTVIGTSPQAPRGVTVTAERHIALRDAHVAIDFTLPEAVPANLEVCAELGIPIVLGTTGLDAATSAAVAATSTRIAVLHAANMSVGVNVMFDLVAAAVRALGPDSRIEIFDLHHKDKRDAPSGTALKLGEAAAHARGQTFDPVATRDRFERAEAQGRGEISFRARREGDHVGEHTVTLRAPGETLSLTHRATDRLTFARGALRAAAWLIGKPAGMYQFRDVIENKTAGYAVK